MLCEMCGRIEELLFGKARLDACVNVYREARGKGKHDEFVTLVLVKGKYRTQNKEQKKF